MALILYLLSAFLFGTDAATTWEKVSIYLNGSDALKIKTDILDSTADVEAYFMDTMETTGWGVLQVQINNNNPNKDSITDEQRSYASGYAEGMLTAQRIYQQYNNMKDTDFWNFTDGPSQELLNWMKQQKEWENDMISKNPRSDYWKMVSIIQEQVKGLWDGYNHYAMYYKTIPVQNTSWIFEFFQIMPDLMDLENVFNITSRINYKNANMTPNEYYQYLMKRNHCSAIIKVSPTLDDILFGHTTWMVYQNINRIYKHYIFNFNELKSQKSVYQSFSSYPAILGSQDDYYMNDELVLLQTTNSIINESLYDLLTTKSLYYYQRMSIANRLSSTGPEWYNLFKQYNSGTYNNQYMLLDYKLFKPGQPLPDDGLLFVVEQIPGLVAGQDFTNILERGYWASYNVPAIQEIYEKSGYPELVKAMGPTFSYDLAPRARIFRRDANTKIVDINGLKDFLRYNNFKYDSIENDNPTWAIAARGDLEKINGSPFGGYDTKCANLTMLQNMETMAINGPTQSKGNPNGEQLQPFSWKDWPSYSDKHQGIPDVVDFSWQKMKKIF